jgi:DNA-binding NarL/FixJ family response regulator
METNAKRKIVLIDDHEIVRLGLSHIINAEKDLEVVAQSGDAQSGLTEIITHKPDIAVVDINMPGMNAFDMVKTAISQMPSLKVIFLTAYSTDSNIERAMNSGALGFVTKSESLGNIVIAIREVLAGHTPYFSSDVRGRMISTGRVSKDATTEAIAKTVAARKSLLSPREIEVLSCVAQGQSAKQIAGTLHISAKTVERHKSNIMSKLSLHTQVDLTRYAIREGIISA